jgi:hypothetical protein
MSAQFFGPTVLFTSATTDDAPIARHDSAARTRPAVVGIATNARKFMVYLLNDGPATDLRYMSSCRGRDHCRRNRHIFSSDRLGRA